MAHQAVDPTPVAQSATSSDVVGLIDIIEPIEPAWLVDWGWGLVFLASVLTLVVVWRWLRRLPIIAWWIWLRQQKQILQSQQLQLDETSYPQWLWQSASALQNWSKHLADNQVTLSRDDQAHIQAWQALAFRAPQPLASKVSRETLDQLETCVVSLQKSAVAGMRTRLKRRLCLPAGKRSIKTNPAIKSNATRQKWKR